jgi:hypothetical protein
MTEQKQELEQEISASEDSISTTQDSAKSNRYQGRTKKKQNDKCYTLNLLEQCGNIYVVKNDNTYFIAKIRKVQFDDTNSNSNELFEKGKKDLGNYFKEDIKNIPDITFWYQRYYYYQRFDEGIQMDYESKNVGFMTLGWYSVTPEELAKYTAELCGKEKIVVDGFCGSGGNVIQVYRNLI